MGEAAGNSFLINAIACREPNRKIVTTPIIVRRLQNGSLDKSKQQHGGYHNHIVGRKELVQISMSCKRRGWLLLLPIMQCSALRDERKQHHHQENPADSVRSVHVVWSDTLVDIGTVLGHTTNTVTSLNKQFYFCYPGCFTMTKGFLLRGDFIWPSRSRRSKL